MIRRWGASVGCTAVVFSCAACLGVGTDEERCEFAEGVDLAPADNVSTAIDPAFRVVSPEVRTYLEERLQTMEIVATTTTKRGNVYDWIDIRSQVPGGVIATPPPLDPVPGYRDWPAISCEPIAARGELEEEPEARGPPGTVPVLRIDPDRIYAPGSVQDFLSKYGDASDLPTYGEDVIAPQGGVTRGHYHAKTQWVKENYGGERLPQCLAARSPLSQ